MRKREYSRGFTLLEVSLAFALGISIFLIAARMFPNILKFTQRGQARSAANMQARQCLETIERILANGRSSTVVIDTPPGPSMIPHSQITFESVQNSTYTIVWSTSPPNSVHVLNQRGAIITNSVLAQNVTGLLFSVDYRDPSIIDLTFQMTVSLDASQTPDSLFTILLPNQVVRMNSN